MKTEIDKNLELNVLGLAISYYLPPVEEGATLKFTISPDKRHLLLLLKYNFENADDQECYTRLRDRLCVIGNFFMRQHLMAGIIETADGGRRIAQLWMESNVQFMRLLSGYLVTTRFGSDFGSSKTNVDIIAQAKSNVHRKLIQYRKAAEAEMDSIWYGQMN